MHRGGWRARVLAGGIRALLLGGFALAASSVVVAPTAASADSTSLYQGAAPRPGPDILYAPLATSPLLTNAPGSVWQAPPILVSGTTAYRQGEFLYQDWIYDDRGGAGGGMFRDPGDVRGGVNPSYAGNGGEDAINPSFGTYTYPQNRAVYAENAADLVELRVRNLDAASGDATAFRVTLNTMTPDSISQDAVAFTIAIGSPASATRQFPHGAQSKAPADAFLTVHGGTADLLDAATLTSLGTVPAQTVDLNRRQVEVRIPHALWSPPTNHPVRLTAGVGLWDHAAGKYLVPQFASDATHPGGLGNLSASSASAFFNVAFRDTRQGLPNSETVHPVNTWADPAHGALAEPTYWRDYAQGVALRTGDLGAFHADVDFGKMVSGQTDDSQIPTSGPMDRLFSSHWNLGQGVEYGHGGCSGLQSQVGACPPEDLGQLQPYAIYVPAQMPSTGYGMTLLEHSLSASYNQYYGQHYQQQYGERDGVHTSIVITTEARGPDQWYLGIAGADPFEAWADAASHYNLDPGLTDIGGYSMGGYSTYKLTTQYPDLFAAAHPTVGPPAVGIWVPPLPPSSPQYTNTNSMLASLRNVPFLIWNGVNDELVPYPGTQAQANTDLVPGLTALTQANSFDALGYRYQFWLFAMPPGLGHLGLTLHDNFQPGADFFGDNHVDPNPPHVTYIRNPSLDAVTYGTTADHAYWLSAINLRDGSGAAPLGTIDVRSEGFGVGDPTSSGTNLGGPAMLPGTVPACCLYTTQGKTWGPAPVAPVADVLDITAKNISDVTVNIERARVDCNVTLHVTSDGPLTVHIPACGTQVAFAGPVNGVTATANPVPGAKGLPNTSRGAGLGAALLAAGALVGVIAAAPRRRRTRGRHREPRASHPES